MRDYFQIVSIDKKARLRLQLWVLGFVAFSLIIIYLTPTVYLFSFLGIETVNGCPLLTFAGIPCPMCGLGRSFSCLTDFHIMQSFYYNPSGLILYLITGIILALILTLSFQNKKIILTQKAKRLWYLPMILLFMVWALNILYGHHH